MLASKSDLDPCFRTKLKSKQETIRKLVISYGRSTLTQEGVDGLERYFKISLVVCKSSNHLSASSGQLSGTVLTAQAVIIS